MNTSDLIDIIVVAVPTAIGALIWFAKLEMRLRFLLTQHNECKKERQMREEALLETVQRSAVDIAVVRTDVGLMKELLLNGRKPPIIQGDE